MCPIILAPWLEDPEIAAQLTHILKGRPSKARYLCDSPGQQGLQEHNYIKLNERKVN